MFARSERRVSTTGLALDRAPAGAIDDGADDRLGGMTSTVEAIAEYTESSRLGVPAWIPRLLASYMSRLIPMRMSVSKARVELGWRPGFPTSRMGPASIARQAA